MGTGQLKHWLLGDPESFLNGRYPALRALLNPKPKPLPWYTRLNVKWRERAGCNDALHLRPVLKALSKFLLFFALPLFSQTLSIGRTDFSPALPGSVITLNLSLSNANVATLGAPQMGIGSVQWNLGVTAGTVSITSPTGTALTSGASTACLAGSTLCLLYNERSNTALTDGPIATLTLMVPTLAPTTITVSLSGVSGSTLGGNPIPIAAGPPLVLSVATPSVHINAGSSTDHYFVGGWNYTYPNSPTPFPTMRYGNFSYSIPVTPGDYLVSLSFVERIVTTSGAHVFNVSLNGQTVLQNFDIFALAGSNVPIARAFPVTAFGTITLQFSTVTRNATVNAIDISPVPSVHYFTGPANTMPAACPSAGLTFWVATDTWELFWCMGSIPWIKATSSSVILGFDYVKYCSPTYPDHCTPVAVRDLSRMFPGWSKEQISSYFSPLPIVSR
jgi:hypothetical protein